MIERIILKSVHSSRRVQQLEQTHREGVWFRIHPIVEAPYQCYEQVCAGNLSDAEGARTCVSQYLEILGQIRLQSVVFIVGNVVPSLVV